MSQKIDTEGLLFELQRCAINLPHFVIAVSGFGGAGKSTTAEKIAKQLGDACIVHLDDFIVDQLSVRTQDWDGFDWRRLTDQVLAPVAEGADEIEYDVYNWKSNTTTSKKKVKLNKFVIIEGVGLVRHNLKNYFDLTVWLDVPLNVASARGKRRDVEDYGVPHHAELWDSRWMPNDRDYFEKYRPDINSDFLLEI